MNRASPALNPAFLPPETQVGSWRVIAWAGRGVHGAVYRAVPVGQEHAEPVALKLALLPRNPRFAREVELLSRLSHPSIPSLRDHGHWQHPSGVLYPFLAMKWIEGSPLYDWARLHNPTSCQLLQLFAQLARALQAVHEQGGVHRDVKGDNILVRRADNHAFLTDFGLGLYSGAPTLTPEALPPATPAYRPPEAWLFARRFIHDRSARYSAGPSDDLYSLGVTAYRLVTGQYPELGEPTKDETGTWQLPGSSPPAPSVLNPRVAPPLNALILRMLSVRPEDRRTVAKMAEALERAAEDTPPESTRPIFAQEVRVSTMPEAASSQHAEVLPPEEPSHARVSGEFLRPLMHARPWQRLLATAAAVLALIIWVWRTASELPVTQPSLVQNEAAGTGQKDGGTVGLGEAASAVSKVDDTSFSPRELLAEDPLPEPRPGQTRPDAKGRCPHSRQTVLNEGCWRRLTLEREECEELNGSMFKNTCYLPIFLRERRPTSSPVTRP